ncbi:hypothetical protein DSCO28_30180 [Desulfosarcina ovata subsp. sediminis]|uniref:Uncharacterized protein n=1 Tax=Desulfosarcina ovata subsp. sediminis TaxID=885957 RepID=A0A5K7ZJW3_9BACT|nr:hypothetical protein [Desulfosarcina ovata]BBO82452.1 hypothetical protein DSCO28_30180 [Desulfosarcina ovata subsp. sediminis]
MPTQICPLCGKKAKYDNPPGNSEEYKCFLCPVGGSFVISLMAEDHFAKFPIIDRTYYSDKAKDAKKGKVLIIQFCDDGSEAPLIQRYDEKAEWFR